jgi:uncharacterized integral membrane protein
MNLRTLSIVIGMALVAGFALLNWAAFTAPTALSLGFATVQAPLGLIMLVATGLVSGLFLVYIVFQQAGLILEARRYAKELKAQRELADKAEASRFTELQDFLARELGKLEAQASANASATNTRIKDLEQQLAAKLEEATRSLSAYVGEVDDKLDRMQQPRLP